MDGHLKKILRLPINILANMDRLMVHRVGEGKKAFMITREILGYVSPNKTYLFDSDLHLYPSKTQCACSPKSSLEVPLHVVLNGSWEKDQTFCNTNANILGGMGMLVVNNYQSIQIPVITATEENLGFYNAQLLSIGDRITFESNQDLPLTEMSIGSEYVNLYLSKLTLGGGEYIEYHNEPHLWAPKHANCRGHILLGKREENKFYLTGFQIPFEHAVYLSPNTLHSDAYLVGDYLVVYTLSKAYSTVLFRDEKKQLKRLKFISKVKRSS